MPYSGVSDESLPSNVIVMPTEKRAQWVEVFNSCIKAGDDEGMAIAKATSIVNKIEPEEENETEETPDKEKPSSESKDEKKVTKELEENLFATIFRRIKEALGIGPVQGDSVRTMIFVKEGDRYRFFTVYTNCFKDSHKEIITDAAHREYVDWATRTGKYPELHLWHSGSKSKWGQIDWLEYISGFVCASGLIDSGKEYIAEALKEQDLSVSHGFVGIWTKGDIIALYRTFEISPLPLGQAANNYVDFNIRREKEMPFTATKKEWLKNVAKLDDATVDEWEKSVDKLSANVKALGIEYKEETESDIVLQFKSMTDIVGSMVEAIAGMKTQIETTVAAVEAIRVKQVDINTELDKRVADAFVAEISKMPKGFSATSSKENVVDTKATKPDVAWFGDIIKDAVKGAQE
jgi:hypothetical protein